MKKGISPIVSVVLLIALAVIAAVGIYFWAAGLTTKQPTPQKPIPIVANPIGNGKVLIANLGQKTINTSTLRGSDPNLDIKCEKETIAPGEQVLCNITGTPSSNTIAIYGEGTGSTVIHITNETSGGSSGGGTTDNPPTIESITDNSTDGTINQGELLQVNATVIDDHGVDTVLLENNATGSFENITMNPTEPGSSTYTTTIDASSSGTLAYRVWANDTSDQWSVSEWTYIEVKPKTSGATVQWYKTYDWNGDDEIRALFVDGSGIYMTGYETPSDRNMKTAKADLSGNLTWNRTVGDGDGWPEYGNAIIVYGHIVYLTGLNVIDGDYEGSIFMYDTDTGNDLGSTSPYESGYDEGNDILYLSDNVYVTGYGRHSDTNAADLLKASSSGAKQFFEWTYDTQGDDESRDITTDGTYLYTTGKSNVTAGASNTTNTLLQKIAQDGTVIYNKTYDFGDGQEDFGTGIVFLNNSLFITGRYYNSSTGHYNLYLSKLDLDGNVQFTKKYDLGADSGEETGILGKITTDGIYIYGVGMLLDPSNEYTDGVLFKLDQNGNLVWKETINIGQHDGLFGVAYYNGLIYTGGYTDINGNKDWLLAAWKE